MIPKYLTRLYLRCHLAECRIAVQSSALTLGLCSFPVFQETVRERHVGVLVGALSWQQGLGGSAVLGTVGVVLSVQCLGQRLACGQS